MASWISLACGIIGLVIIGATVFAMWESIHSESMMANASGADIIGFYPLFAFIVMGPVIMGVALTPKAKTVVGWLGLILNAAPYVAFFVGMWFL